MLYSTVDNEPGGVPDFAQVAAALARAQAKFLPLVRSKSVTIKPRDGAAYTFWYAPLEDCIASVRPALSSEELALVQSVVQIPEGAVMRTWLLHSSGQFLAGDTPLIVEAGGPKGYGAAETYSRRYGVSTLLGLAADDDNDAAETTGEGVVRTKPGDAEPLVSLMQVKQLQTLLKAAGSTEEALAEHLKVPALKDLPASRFAYAMEACEKKAKAAKAPKPPTRAPQATPEDHRAADAAIAAKEAAGG
jgi:ERF superfamily